MLISEISNYTTWVGDIRKTIVREIFKYDEGNDVIVVTVHGQEFAQLYSEKGKEVSQTEYNEIIKKKMEEMQEMNAGPGGGNRMQFRMGR